MGRITLHRIEQSSATSRLVATILVVVILGFMSGIVSWLIASEAYADTFAPIAQKPGYEWSAESLSIELPIAAGFIALPILTALAVGANGFAHSGFVSFMISVFNLLPFASGGYSGTAMRNSPVLWVTFVLGTFVALYIGDAAGWFYRRYLRYEQQEDIYIHMRDEYIAAEREVYGD